jgi:hypothetical protein
MRVLMDQQSYDELQARSDHTADCYVRPGQYLHHMYRNGIKYVVARALYTCLAEAKQREDAEALAHLNLHEAELRALVTVAKQSGTLDVARPLGDPDPVDQPAKQGREAFTPALPGTWEDTGLNRSILLEMILRTIYAKSRATGNEIADDLRLFYGVIAPLLTELRGAEYVDIAGQRGVGDTNYEYILTSRGTQAVSEALQKTQYTGPCPVPLDNYIEAMRFQTIKNVVVTRRSIRQAFSDLIISEPVLNEVGPAVNSASSIFLFGYPGNGKTSIAERITRLMGDAIYIPYAIEADGQIIKVFDPIVHTEATEQAGDPFMGSSNPRYDLRWARIKRPVVVVGGELTLPMLDLTYNEHAKFYEAPFQMKANGGIFLIDDFGRQQVRPIDLLNRWIVPLEKRYDYLTTVTGKKLEIPFDQLIIFSSNLDPQDLADEAFLRRIKYKINVLDPDEAQWRQIWQLVCKGRKIPYDDKGIDYLLGKWYRPFNRPLRMCQPRDLLDQMISMAKYSMEEVTLANPDLLDAACRTYFVTGPKQSFGAKTNL